VAQEGFVLAVGVEEHVEAHGRAQPRLGPIRRRDGATHARQEVVECAVEDREQDLLLGAKVIVEACRLHPKRTRQRAHRAAVVAALAEEDHRRAQDALGGRGALLRGDDRGDHGVPNGRSLCNRPAGSCQAIA